MTTFCIAFYESYLSMVKGSLTLFAGVVDTGEQFFGGVVDTGDKF